MLVENQKGTKIFKVDIDPRVVDQMKELFERRNISQVAGATSLFKWLLSQDELFQSIILGQVPDDSVKEVAQLILKRLSKSGPGKKLHPDQ